MARVYNWQIGRQMSYWYPENRPQKQFAAVFDINKCIACQTCTLACKTTWTSGKGQEYMLWNNVETKPYGFYPLAWDLNVLNSLEGQTWRASDSENQNPVYEGRTLFEAAPPGERVLGWQPEEQDYAYPNVGEDDCAGVIENGASLQVPHLSWFFYLARICNHCTYPACLASCPRGSIYKRPEDGIVLLDQSRCRGYQECVKGCPYKKVFFNPMTGTSEKCIACFPKIEQGIQPQCFVNCIGKIRLAGWISTPDKARPDNPLDYLVHIRKIALPLFPQFGLEPNVYYIPPVHTPSPFLKQMFGPGADEAVKAYRAAADDPDLSGLLGLFGSTELLIPRWRRRGDWVSGLSESGAEVVRVPLKEPVLVRPAFDRLYQISRVNCP
jgi:nitrate reductase beta subunit